MASDLDSAVRLFSGKWEYARDELFMEALEKMKFPKEQVDVMSQGKPIIFIEGRGNSIYVEVEIAPIMKHGVPFELGKEVVSKNEENETPEFHSIEVATFENDALTIKAWSKMEGPDKVDYKTVFTRKGDELHSMISPLDDVTKISGVRIYKLIK